MEYQLTASDEKSGQGDENGSFDDEEILYFSDHESSGFLDNNEFENRSDQPVDLKRYLKQRPTIQSRVAKAYHSLTFANVKRFLQWLMDKASLKIEISVSASPSFSDSCHHFLTLSTYSCFSSRT